LDRWKLWTFPVFAGFRRANASCAPRTAPKRLNLVSNDRKLNRLSFETKLSSFGASKREKLCFEGARGNFGPFWKLWTTFIMAAAYAMYMQSSHGGQIKLFFIRLLIQQYQFNIDSNLI
jgi:hypothetical protein